jgi:hypothetical protein
LRIEEVDEIAAEAETKLWGMYEFALSDPGRGAGSHRMAYTPSVEITLPVGLATMGGSGRTPIGRRNATLGRRLIPLDSGYPER